MRVIRVLEYIGDKDWIESTMRFSFVSFEKPFLIQAKPSVSITELCRYTEDEKEVTNI